MSTGIGGLIVAHMIIDDMERQRGRNARRAERRLAKAARSRRTAGNRRRDVGSLDGPRVPAFPEP